MVDAFVVDGGGTLDNINLKLTFERDREGRAGIYARHSINMASYFSLCAPRFQTVVVLGKFS